MEENVKNTEKYRGKLNLNFLFPFVIETHIKVFNNEELSLSMSVNSQC